MTESAHDEGPAKVLAPAGDHEFVAYELASNPGYVIEPASPMRDWMDRAPGRTPYRCLPLAIANQAGWIIRCPGAFSAKWNGKTDTSGLTLDINDQALAQSGFAASNFGMGIITFRMPWLFRTPKGIGLWVHGPANEPKDNLTAFEGIVETDWLESPFTMNWKIQRRNSPVYFKEGEAICMLTPFPLDLLEIYKPEFRQLSDQPELMRAVDEARKRRLALVDKQSGSETGETLWERNYMKGEHMSGARQETHRTNLKIKPFGRQG